MVLVIVGIVFVGMGVLDEVSVIFCLMMMFIVVFDGMCGWM